MAAAIKAAEALPLLDTAVERARAQEWFTSVSGGSDRLARDYEGGGEKRRRVGDIGSKALVSRAYGKLYAKLQAVAGTHPALAPLVQILEAR